VITIRLVLLIAALLCFVVAAFGVPSRVQLVPAGLALWILSLLIVTYPVTGVGNIGRLIRP
jgi:hypothetical protein